MLSPKKRKALAKAMNETNVEEKKPEIPKMEIKRELAKHEEATGSIYSRKGKKPGDTFYKQHEMPSGEKRLQQMKVTEGGVTAGVGFSKLNKKGKPYTSEE